MKPRLRHRVEYALFRLLAGVLQWLPTGVARRVGEIVGRFGYRPLGIRRTTVERQIAAAFPGLSHEDVTRMAAGSYAHLGRVAIELVLMAGMKQEGIAALFEEDSDFGVIEQARRAHGTFVACTGHVGNWELAGAYLALRGLPVDAVARRIANPLFDGYLTRIRSRTGMRVVYDSDSVRVLTRGLKEGRVPGLVADQGVLGLASTYVSFFGRPAKTPRGPAVFAIKYQVPMIFCAAILQRSGRYRFVAREIPVATGGDRERNVDDTMARFSRVLENIVRRYPEQYFWQHKRWKRQPPGTPPELRDPSADR